jgi:phage baseplate assembly protein gpV
MKTDPANSTFSVTLPGVKGSGKIFSSQEVRWAVTDTFEVPAVNWRKSRYPDGRLKTYDDPQWHLKVTGHEKSKAMRYLTILQISPNADLNQILTENKPGKNRNVDLAIGQWSVSANLNTDVTPSLVIRKKDGRVAFSIDSKEINLKGEIFNGNQENSSLLIEKKNGQPFIQEAGDSIPEAMRNVLLYH